MNRGQAVSSDQSVGTRKRGWTQGKVARLPVAERGLAKVRMHAVSRFSGILSKCVQLVTTMTDA